MSFRKWILGAPRDLRDRTLFHKIALITFFAWVGLGADGLSSSAYGPEEAFKHLVDERGVPHYYLAVFMALAIALTVFIISAAYSRIIEHFPHGGGGYVVATKLLGARAGVVSGCALVVDYVLTIAISIAAGTNAVFAFLPAELQGGKFAFEIGAIVLLTLLNWRGVKESVQVLTPIFLTFLATHVAVIAGAIALNIDQVGPLASSVRTGLSQDLSSIGAFGLVLLFARAYSLGGGTYTGIESLSNGIEILREPRVETGKRTMKLMAISLAVTAAGIIFGYLLLGIRPSPFEATDPRYEPMNALLIKRFAGDWQIGGLPIGKGFIVLTLLSEGALLFVAALSGFIDGPRVMANMALDSWVPHNFAALSERLTIRNGITLMGIGAAATLIYTRGSVDILVVMYSINVFLTFALSQAGMARYWFSSRKDPRWKTHIWIFLVGFLLCSTVLVVTVLEKFLQGGWVTLLVTSLVIGLAYWVRSHYRRVADKVRRLNEELVPLLVETARVVALSPAASEMDPVKATAVVLVANYSGLGLRTFLDIERIFPGQYKQAMFISAGIVNSGTFKGADEVDALRGSVKNDLERYVEVAKSRLGWAADFDMVIGTDAVSELERLCREVQLRFPRSVFFAGQLVFHQPTWRDRLLHNETAYAVQRRLQFDRFPMVILPVRML